MKQVLSVADLAVMYDIAKNEIAKAEEFINCAYDIELTSKQKQKKREERKLIMASNTRYNAMLRIKKALETLNVEIETPDLKVKEEENDNA